MRPKSGAKARGLGSWLVMLDGSATGLTPCTGPGASDNELHSSRSADRVIESRSASAAPAGYRFPREVIAVAVRWYLRHGLSYRDVEELLAERGVEVDHVTVYRWVQTFTSEFIDSARPGPARGGRPLVRR